MKRASGSSLTILLIISTVVAFILLSLQSGLVNFQRQVGQSIYLQTLMMKARNSAFQLGTDQGSHFTSYELVHSSNLPWQYSKQGRILLGHLSQVLANPVIGESHWRILQSVVSVGSDEAPRIFLYQRQTWQLLEEGVVVASETQFPTLIGD